MMLRRPVLDFGGSKLVVGFKPNLHRQTAAN
jgi:hypothetical protein